MSPRESSPTNLPAAKAKRAPNARADSPAKNTVRAEDALEKAHNELQKRTAELSRANALLRRQIGQRERAREALRDKSSQLEAITKAMTVFLDTGNWNEASAFLLSGALNQTGSEYGFVGVVVEGPALRILSHKGMIWNEGVDKEFYQTGMRTNQELGYVELTDFESLFVNAFSNRGELRSGKPDSSPDSGARTGLPPLSDFLGVPVFKGRQVVGMIGVANRPGGYTGIEQAKIEILMRSAGVLFDSYRRQQLEAALEADRARAEEEVKVRARQQAAVAELGQRALGGAEINSLMNLAVVLTAQALEVEHCSVLELLPAGEELVLRAGVGSKEDRVERVTIAAGSASQAGYTLLSSAPVIVEDLNTETRFTGRSSLREQGLVSGISVVIEGQDQPFGVFAANTTRRRTFSKDDCHFLQSVANVLAETIKRKLAEETLRRNRDELELRVQQRTSELVTANALLREEIADRKVAERRLSMQHAVTRILAESTAPADALPQILASICKILEWDVGELWNVDREANVLRLDRIWHIDAIRTEELAAASRQAQYSPGIGLPGRVWDGCAPVWIADLKSDPTFTSRSAAVEEGLQSAFGFPIVLVGEVVGVADFFSRDSRKPDEDLLSTMTAIGNQIGQFIERRQAEETLRIQSAIVGNMAEGVRFVRASDSVIIYANPRCEEMFGYDTGELSGRPIEMVIAEDDEKSADDVVADIIKQLSESGEAIVEVHNVRKNGTTFWCRSHTSQFDHPEYGNIWVSVLEDITGRKQAEEQIKQRNRELAALNTAIAAVSESLELSEVLATLRGLLVEQLDVPAGGIFLYDDADDLFRLHSAWGLPAEVLAKIETFPAGGFHDDQMVPRPDAILSLEFGEFGEIASLLASVPDSGKVDWQSYLRVPLVAKGEIQGIAALLSFKPSMSSEDQVSFFKTLGQQVGVAIHNARLFEQVRAARLRLQTVSQRLVDLQEAERRNIARELHDEIGQQLTGLKLALEMCGRSTGDQAHGYMDKALALANETTERVHDLSLDLRPTILDDLGLLPALLWQFERYTATSNIQVSFDHQGLERRFDPAVETAAYRIVQEAVTNVARHSGASAAIVRIWSDENLLSVMIEDRGVGFDSRAALDKHTSSGLEGMRERARLLGGRLEIESAPGVGCRLTVELPLFRQSD
jgi:PAS domain S-box-containing protein